MSENILGHWDKGTANLTLKEMMIMYEGVSPHQLCQNNVSSIIWHYSSKEFDRLGDIGGNLVKRYIVLLLVVDMAYCQDCLHQTPIPCCLVHMLQVAYEFNVRQQLFSWHFDLICRQVFFSFLKRLVGVYGLNPTLTILLSRTYKSNKYGLEL